MEALTTSVAEENGARVSRGYAAFNTADMATLAELFHPDAVWYTPGKSPIAGTFKGRDAVFAHFGQYGAETHGSFKAMLRETVANDNNIVVGVHQNTGTRNGKTLDVSCCIVFEFKDGKVSSGREYFFDLHAWDAFWS